MALSSDRVVAGRLQPVERKRLADLAYSAIRDGIISSAFAMGQRLVETQLAAELGMSRAPVREALQLLAKEGLVDEYPHQGTFVRTLSPADVSDLYNVRLGLETTAIRLFMKRGASTEPLHKAIRHMEQAANRGHRAEVVRRELEFHRSIAVGAENPTLADLFSNLEGRILMVMALDDQSFENLHEVPAEHVPVVDAIDAGDAERAVIVLEEHLLSTVGKAVERLGGDPSLLLAPLQLMSDRPSPRRSTSKRAPTAGQRQSTGSPRR